MNSLFPFHIIKIVPMKAGNEPTDIKISSESINLVCTISGLNKKKFPAWTNIKLTPDYSVSFELIGSNILLTIPSGRSRTKGMPLLTEKRKEFLIEQNLYEVDHVEVRDYTNISGNTSKISRTQFADFLLDEQKRRFLLAYFGFNAPFTIKILFNMGIRFFKPSIPVIMLSSYHQAIKNAVNTIKKRDRNKLIHSPELDFKKTENIEKYFRSASYTDDIMYALDNFYEFISSTNWSDPGTVLSHNAIPKNHPFKPLYDALTILKSDFDEVLEDKTNAEKILKQINTRMEEKILERTHQLAEKNTILETSLSILSHDTKNLFFNISYLIDQELEGPVRTLFKESYDELYDNIMETTGYIKEHKRIFSLVEIIKGIKVTGDRVPIEKFARTTINYNGAPELYFVETTTLFKNAVTNLVENAIKYTPENSPVNIEIYRDKTDITIDVVDFGEGIPDNEKEKILKKGFRRKSTSEIEGTGRGLWITKNIIEKAAGSLSILDNPQAGSIFRITIPVFKIMDFNQAMKNLASWFDIPQKVIMEKAENIEMLLEMSNKMSSAILADKDTYIFISILNRLRMENRGKTSENIQFKLETLKSKNPDGKTVLIVDDSLYVHYYLASYFTNLGFRILGFEYNGRNGLNSYLKLKPDIITLDNTMPVLSGSDAALEIFKQDKEVKILFITALAESTILKEKISQIPEKNYQIISKPIKQDELKDKIDNILI